MNEQQRALWKRLQQFQLDLTDVKFPFSARLARENDWTPAYSQRVIDEYKKFLFLCCEAGHAITPSDQVDQVWHLHLLYTRSYWENLCQDVLRKPIHHGPTKGGDADRSRFKNNYANTMESYQRFFGEAAPKDIWPEEKERFGEIHFTRINRHRNWVIAKRNVPFHPVGGLVVGALLFLVPFIIYADSELVPTIIFSAVILFLVGAIIIALREGFLAMLADIRLIRSRMKLLKDHNKPVLYWHKSMLSGFAWAVGIGAVIISFRLIILAIVVCLVISLINWYRVIHAMYLRKRKTPSPQNDTDDTYIDMYNYGDDYVDDYHEPSDYEGGGGDWGSSWSDSTSTGDSGCSYDSGCSGCSGCGGCGGCD